MPAGTCSVWEGPLTRRGSLLAQVQLERGSREGASPVEQKRSQWGSLLRVGLLENADLSRWETPSKAKYDLDTVCTLVP